jgi:regulatory factor X
MQFISDIVIDLLLHCVTPKTIRSDPAFGAFQILKLFLDDWVALNVLRSVALSTNSVAASVEPLMQQQFLSLSPMPGQEFTGTLDARPTHPHTLIPDTPTTSSMLAALTATEPFGQNPYVSMSYGGMDGGSSQADLINPMGSVSMPFSDFGGPSGASFDMSTFTTHDLSLGNTGNGENGNSPTGSANGAADSASASASAAASATGARPSPDGPKDDSM